MKKGNIIIGVVLTATDVYYVFMMWSRKEHISFWKVEEEKT